MPSYRQETIKYHIERVREVLALKPRAGCRVIKEVLSTDKGDPLNLDEWYIISLKRKIAGERVHRFDNAKVEKALSEIQDRVEGVIAQMWGILLDQNKDDRARVAAGKVIIDAEHKFLEAQLATGIYERKLGSVDIHHHQLTPDQQIAIIRVFTNYGIIKPANIIEQPTGILNERAGNRIAEQPANAA